MPHFEDSSRFQDNLEALRDFADAGARDAPPVFVGRLDVIADIKRQAELTATRAAGSAANDNAGRTRLVFGAPGAGKTALLRQLEQLNAESDQASVGVGLPAPGRQGPGFSGSPRPSTCQRAAEVCPGRVKPISCSIASQHRAWCAGPRRFDSGQRRGCLHVGARAKRADPNRGDGG